MILRKSSVPLWEYTSASPVELQCADSLYKREPGPRTARLAPLKRMRWAARRVMGFSTSTDLPERMTLAARSTWGSASAAWLNTLVRETRYARPIRLDSMWFAKGRQ